MHVASVFAVGLLLGGQVFFSAVMAPLVFMKLEGPVAGKFIRAVFPWFYLYVLAFSALAAVALATSRPWDGVAMAVVALATLGTRQALVPWINRLRDRSLAGDTAAGKRFDLLHRVSVYINLAQMVAAAVVLFRLAVP